MRVFQLWFLASCSLVTGCVADGSTVDPGGQHPLPSTTRSYRGSYLVPTSDELASAAIFSLDRVDWKVEDGTVTLRYDLPIGLVGGTLAIRLSGPIEAGSTQVTLTGQGAGSCVSDGIAVTCNEALADLGVLPISMGVVERAAATEYAGPVADRVAVAQLFSSDPLGVVSFVLPSSTGDDGDREEAP